MGTRWTVRAADKLSRVFITVGGIGTIIAVSAVFVFLVSVALPLFRGGSAGPAAGVPGVDAAPVHFAVDEYRVMGWTLSRDGTLRAFRMDTGEPLVEQVLIPGDSVAAWSIPPTGRSIAVALIDGSVRLGTIGFRTDYPDAHTLPAAAGSLETGQLLTADGAVVERTPEGQFRRQRLEFDLSDPIEAVPGEEIVQVDHVRDGEVLALFTARGELHVETVVPYENLLTGAVTYEVDGGFVSTRFGREGQGRGLPARLVLSESGNGVSLLWRDGTIAYFDTRDLDDIALAGSVDLLDGDVRATAFGTLIGRSTFLIGDEAGVIHSAFQYAPGEESVQSMHMATPRSFRGAKAAVTAITPSPRSRLFAAGYADGTVRLFQGTSGAEILDVKVDGAVATLAITPKGDGLAVVTPASIQSFDIDAGYPEATIASMFTPVWYEGYPGPAHVWQSSSATDDFEPKFGMWPLIFGTLKATVYSMLFGIPLALLAAIFTSEFMSPGTRPRVKTLIESMASLPSVVLGFLAALVFAPFVQRVVPSVMVGFVTLPFVFLLGAHLYQLLPQSAVIRYSRFRLVFTLLLLPLGVALAGWLGPLVERLLFDGDMILWLDGQQGSGFGGWVVLLLPLGAVAVVMLMGRYAGPRFREFAARSGREAVALADLGRFLAGAVLTLLLVLLVSWLLTLVGADPRGRGAMLDTYVQRNALVVGFVMGFAVIPIIYTIAEDALSAVPDHLRAASLGAGATPWQTAMRIVLPTAMSGLFSAIMIGLGRAVGETMIVLMAAGNTPIMEMNIFNGFRTLSANIAVELPEAVRGSTHYRTLFLAALLLFAMTFSINTVAEMVRLRFRKRSAQI